MRKFLKVSRDNVKTDSLTRGEILVGMELGLFREGDRFKSTYGFEAKIIDYHGLMLVNEKNEDSILSMMVSDARWTLCK